MVEYCDHQHSSQCQEQKDCPCVKDHECKDGIITQEESCEVCGGEGTIPKYEHVWPGEAPTADIGSQPCPKCAVRETGE